MRSVNKGQFLALVMIGFLGALIVNSCASPPPTPTPVPIPPYAEGILAFTDQTPALFGTEKIEDDDLLREFEAELQNNPDNIRGHMTVAYLWQAGKRYRKAIEHFEIVISLDSTLADPHYALGDVFYELALLDLVARQQYTQHELGFLLFTPDETTRQLFKRALDEYNLGKTLPNSLEYTDQDGSIISFGSANDSRIRQASLYLGGAPEEAVFTIDQSEAAGWMVHLDKYFPESGYLKTSSRVLNFFMEKSKESRVQDLYSRLSQGPIPGSDTFGKQVLLQIDQSSHPNRAYMGTSWFLQYFIEVWRGVCELHGRGADEDMKQSELRKDSITIVTNILDGMSITLPETLSKGLAEDSCRDITLIAAVEQVAYEQLLTKKDHETADIFQISGYVVSLDEFFSIPANKQSDWAQFVGRMIKRLDVIEAKLNLPKELNERLQEQHAKFNQAIKDTSLQQDEGFRAENADWLQDVVAYILTDETRLHQGN